MKASKEMIQAVKSVPSQFRFQAMKLAETTFMKHYNKNKLDWEISEQYNYQLSSLAAVAEIKFRFQ